MNTCDVVIVGGGIIGGSIAFDLAQRKLRVALLDRQEMMREASWAAAGMLSPAPDCPAAIPLVPLGRASLALYPNFVANVEDVSAMRVGYREGGSIEVLFHGDVERELSTLVALHHGLGLACEPLSVDEARNMEPSLGREARAAALLPDECSVEPRRLTAALLAGAESCGSKLHPGVEVRSLVLEGSKCSGVKTAEGEIFHAAHVVLAAGCWSSQIPEAAPFAPTKPVRGQMAAVRHCGKPIRYVLRSEHGYAVPRGTETPQTVVLGSTIEHAGFEKMVTTGGMTKILSAAIELAPELESAEIGETWSGLRPGTPDQLPILGPAGIDRLVFATGHYRNGILLAPITAKLIGEWISDGKTSMDWEAFSPLRFAGENADRTATA
ncbi:MAG TPA: glycine oxidase ThiO [Candidatus Acidoferrales bacterium]|nr:glycine oxidase ThiO [Candidatus Acidoferrales bacterium]